MLALFSFLLVAGILCYVFLAPNSPYIKGRCEKGRSRSQGKLTYVFYPKDTEVRENFQHQVGEGKGAGLRSNGVRQINFNTGSSIWSQ